MKLKDVITARSAEKFYFCNSKSEPQSPNLNIDILKKYLDCKCTEKGVFDIIFNTENTSYIITILPF